MESRSMKITSHKNKKIAIRVIPGHFATNHSHINYCIDFTVVKHTNTMAREAAREMAAEYANSTLVDTVVCMDGCEILGAYLARDLERSGINAVSQGNDICVVTPEFNSNGQMIFRDNMQGMVWNKNIVLLLASVTTGKTINRSLECIKYYGGKVVGISAVFSAIEEQQGVKIHPLFTLDDIPDYRTYAFQDCPDCKEKKKIDAIVNSFGYSKI